MTQNQGSVYGQNYSQLAGGGEMGELTRNFDWSKTSIGEISQWSQSLRSYIGLLLNSRFPMFLFWGPEHLCFYNDAYRPSLGTNGKHPEILGQPGLSAWPEIWHYIGPMISGVLASGEAIWHEDQFLPIYRNGKMEEVYWTFSYSPVRDESGNPAGVFVTCTETTKAVMGYKQIVESQTRFQNLLRDATVGLIVLMGESMRVSVVNKAYCKMIGYSVEETINRPIFDVIPGAENDFRPIIERVRSTGEEHQLKGAPYRVHGADGEVIEGFINLVYQPYREADGRITGVMVVVHDVTEQVLARQNIERSEARFRSLIEEAPVATCLFVGRELKIEVANQMMIDVWGKGPSVIGMPLAEALPELKGQHFLPLLAALFDTGETYEAKGGRADLTINGVLTTFYFDYSFKPLRDEDGNVYAIMEMAMDVTEQVIARQKLEEAKEALRGAVELAQLGTWSIDVATGGLTYSDRLIEWFGYDPAARDYNKVIPILGEGDQERIAAAVARALNSESDGVYDETYTVINPRTGKRRILHAQGKVLRDRDGNAMRMIGTAQDITHQQELQLALENEVQQRTEALEAAYEELQVSNEELTEANVALDNSNKELARSNQSLEEFAHAASHDLKEPIRKIRFFTSQLHSQLSGHLNEDQEITFSKIDNSSERLGNLVDDLLRYSHVNEKPIEMEWVNLNQKLRRVLDDLDLEIQLKGAVIHLNDLPVVKGYRRQLQQLFQNLLSNALKYSKDDVPAVIQISAATTVANGMRLHVIEVKDNGIGFAQEYAEKIFQMFTRLHSKQNYEGTGIGLSIVKKVVENHNGYISAVSTPGEGSTFIVKLPA